MNQGLSIKDIKQFANGMTSGTVDLYFAGGANTPLQSWTCSVCLAYFIFDLGWCLFFKSEGELLKSMFFLPNKYMSLILLVYKMYMLAVDCVLYRSPQRRYVTLPWGVQAPHNPPVCNTVLCLVVLHNLVPVCNTGVLTSGG